MKILIAEDDFTSMEIIRHLLEAYGECHLARNGEEAIKIFSNALVKGKGFDLVCLDVFMPRIDGQTVLKEIRQMEKCKGIKMHNQVKVIMTTCLDDSDNIMEAFKSNCNAYLIKPVSRVKLVEQLTFLCLINKPLYAGAH